MPDKTRSANREKLVVVVGPTAVGKTALSLGLAKAFGGEIVSADSRLFYIGMDIGTAKPTRAELTDVPHHLIDICHPDETLTLGEYQRLAYRTIHEIRSRGKLPILVGGTGQYVMAVVEGWGIPEVAPDLDLRRELKGLGAQELARWLQMLDPQAARRIDARNIRRVIRALEVTLITGRPITELQRKTSPPFDIYMVGLHRERTALYDRIDRRVRSMLQDGLVDEVIALKQAGHGSLTPAMSGLGYRQVMAYLSGELTIEETAERIMFDTHRFARQQATWFRLDDRRIHWFDLSSEDQTTAILAEVERWLKA